ncbi:MAG: PIN domain-containing protein [Acidobacteriota bacterium]
MIFLDTSFLYPLFSEEDVDHARVRDVFESYRGRRRLKDLFFTTNLVIGETITLIRTTPPRIHAAAVKAGEYLFAEKIARVHHVTAEEEREAFEYFKRHQDKEYSFTDCTSFVLMERLGIREALALDSDFTHRFIARPGPRQK